MAQKLAVLEEILDGLEISDFARAWIENSKADEDSIRQVYRLLIEYGLSDEKIATNAALLGMNPDTVERNYKALKDLGLSDEKIATNATLLGRDPETVERNYQRLQKLGLSDEKIASQAALLGRDPEAVKRNYQHHVGLLRQDYRDRGSGRGLLFTYAQLLGMPKETIEANVQYLHSIGVDYNNGILLGTKPQTKREKLAWMLRELFDYREVPAGLKRSVIHDLYEFVREDSYLLNKSINSLERNRERLREKIQEFKN